MWSPLWLLHMLICLRFILHWRKPPLCKGRRRALRFADDTVRRLIVGELTKINADYFRASSLLERIDNRFQFAPHFSRNLTESVIFNRRHGGDRVDSRHLDAALLQRLNDYVARKHGADLVFGL